MHPQRLRQRGYNPALLLCRELGRLWQLPVVTHAVRRLRLGVPQQGCSAEERRRNVRGLFAGNPEVAGRQLLLVDDVCTTTATVRACSQALCQAGAIRVSVLVAGRAPAHTSGLF
jgi:predicted amidophosphoribosyltransferase